MSVLLDKARLFACKTETTVGTAETLTASEAAYNVYNLRINPQIDVAQREGQQGFGRLASVPGARMGVATFETGMPYDGTTIPSWASVLLPACGVPVATGTTYRPKTQVPGSGSAVKTVTIAGYCTGNGTNAKVKSIFGAVGTCQIVAPTGRQIRLRWTFTGVYADEVDVGSLLSPTFPTATELRFSEGASSWAGSNMCLESMTFDLGNVVSPRYCTTPIAGYDSFFISDRNPRVTANPESRLIATQDRYLQFKNQTEDTLSFTIGHPSSNATIVISAPKAQIVNGPQEGVRDGIVTDEIEWQLNRNGSTTDQEFSIVFNHAT
jgi:hypothetical protein